MVAFSKKKILLTSSRSPTALDMARLLHAAGHNVYAIESMRLHICRFSNAVTKSFHAPSPRFQTEGYINKVAAIAQQEKIDLIVPLYEEILYLAKHRHRLPEHCQLFAPSFDLLIELHNKWLFNRKVHSLGMDAPRTFLIKSHDDLKRLDRSITYALKACYSRASGHVFKLLPHDPLPPISIEPNNPWVAQEWLEGTPFCTYSICRDGIVQAHAVYPVGYTAEEKGCILYTACGHDPILKWIQKFVKQINLTGQIAFDFIVTPHNKVMAIECNPRSTSGSLLFQEKDRLDKAFLQHVPSLIVPELGYRKQLGMAMLMHGWKKNSIPNNSIPKFLQHLFGVKDVILNWRDPLPFFSQPITMTEIWYKSLKAKMPITPFFMSDSEWNGE